MKLGRLTDQLKLPG